MVFENLKLKRIFNNKLMLFFVIFSKRLTTCSLTLLQKQVIRVLWWIRWWGDWLVSTVSLADRQLNAWISQGWYGDTVSVCVVVSEFISSTQTLLTIFNDGHSLLTKVLCANGSVISLKHQKPLFGIKVCKQTDDPENRGSFSTDTSRKELSPIRICAFSMMGNSNSN